MHENAQTFKKDIQYFKFCAYGFLKNLKFFEIFIMLFLLNKLGHNYSKVGILYSTLLLTRAVLEIPSGVIADALGRKGSMIFSYGLYIFSFLTFYLAKTYLFLFVPIVLFAVADSFRTGTHKAMIFDYLKINNWENAKTQYYGQTRSWSKIGSAVSVIGAILIQLFYHNFEIVFLFSIVPYLIGLVLLITYPRQLNGEISPNLNIRKKIFNSFKASYQEFKNLKQIKQIFSLSYYFGLHRSLKDYLQPVIFSFAFTLPFNLELSHENQKIIILGTLYFIIYLISSVSSRNAYKIPKYFNSTSRSINLIALAGILTSFFIAIFYGLKLYLIAGLLFIPLFAFSDLQRPSVVSYISENYNPKIMATVLSVESQIGSLVGALLALLAGFITEYVNLALGIGTVSVLSFVLVFLLKIKPQN